MIKIILLLCISNLLMVTQAFFITAKDIQRFFGIAPSFYEIYRKEASQNYPQDDQDEKQENHNHYKKYENNINEKLPSEGSYYKVRPSENAFEYDREYSNKEENTTPYIKNVEDKNCGHHHTHFSEGTKNSDNGNNPRVYFQLPVALSKLQPQTGKHSERNKLVGVGIDDRKKDIVSRILVALPNFNDKEVLPESNYLKNKHGEKYIIKTLFGNTPQPVYSEENDQSGNIFL